MSNSKSFSISTLYFNSFNLVCKHFNSLTLGNTIMKNLELRNVEDEMQYQNALKVMKRSKSLKKFSIIDSESFMDKFIKDIKSNHPNIEALTISVSKPNQNLDIKLPEFAKTIKSIRTLTNLQGLEINNIYIGQDSQIEIAKFETLKHFKINSKGTPFDETCTHFSIPNFFKTLATNSKQLETIELSEDTSGEPEVYQGLASIKTLKSLVCDQYATMVLEILTMRTDGLEMLDLYFPCWDRDRDSAILDAFLKKHGNSLKILRLMLRGIKGNEITLPRNLAMCKNLEELCLTLEFSYIHVDFLHLDFDSISDFNKLKVLKLRARFEYPTLLGSFLTQLNSPVLEKLELKHVYFSHVQDKQKCLDDDIMNILLQKCPKLKTIKLALKHYTWDLSNEYLFELCKTRNIFVCFAHININLCDDFCDKGYDTDTAKRQISMMRSFHVQDPGTFNKYIEMEHMYLRYNDKKLKIYSYELESFS